MVRWVAIAFAALVLPANAQQVVDGSDKNINDDRISAALKSISSDLRDPISAQFRNLHVEKEISLCGEINAKNGYGAYVGFRPFTVNLTDKKGTIVPTPDDAVFGMSKMLFEISGCKKS